MQLDNRVLPGFIPLYGKFERLGRECTQPNMQKPCSATQKWFCVYDNGRWRKHKCKSITSNTKAAIDNKYRKCACFTPNGLIYKKVSVSWLIKLYFTYRNCFLEMYSVENTVWSILWILTYFIFNYNDVSIVLKDIVCECSLNSMSFVSLVSFKIQNNFCHFDQIPYIAFWITQ